MSSDILVIPDPHAQPGTSQERFSWLGNMIVAKKPEVIVCLGDFSEMGSLSAYDVGKVSSEGKRYEDDLACTYEALELIEKPIRGYNDIQRLAKKKIYKPRKVMILGNHDGLRIERARQENPKFFKSFGVEDLGYERYGWEVHQPTEATVIEGIAFAHYFTSGVMGRPIGGFNHARNLLLKNHMSSVVGHSHLVDYSIDQTADGKQIFGLVAGCYFDYDMDWTTENHRYNRGLVYLHDCSDGWAWVEFLGMDFIKERYSE